jgi:hypothetical protein
MKTFLQIASVIAITFCLLARSSGQDLAKVHLKPGDKLPMHSHPNYLVYS